jgi:hypothetical protein
MTRSEYFLSLLVLFFISYCNQKYSWNRSQFFELCCAFNFTVSVFLHNNRVLEVMAVNRKELKTFNTVEFERENGKQNWQKYLKNITWGIHPRFFAMYSAFTQRLCSFYQHYNWCFCWLNLFYEVNPSLKWIKTHPHFILIYFHPYFCIGYIGYFFLLDNFATYACLHLTDLPYK